MLYGFKPLLTRQQDLFDIGDTDRLLNVFIDTLSVRNILIDQTLNSCNVGFNGGLECVDFCSGVFIAPTIGVLLQAIEQLGESWEVVVQLVQFALNRLVHNRG